MLLCILNYNKPDFFLFYHATTIVTLVINLYIYIYYLNFLYPSYTASHSFGLRFLFLNVNDEIKFNIYILLLHRCLIFDYLRLICNRGEREMDEDDDDDEIF